MVRTKCTPAFAMPPYHVRIASPHLMVIYSETARIHR
jgi:hypothetical protein